MASWMGRCLENMPWDSNDLGVAPESTKVRTTITSSILAWTGQVRGPLASKQRVDVDRLVS